MERNVYWLHSGCSFFSSIAMSQQSHNVCAGSGDYVFCFGRSLLTQANQTKKKHVFLSIRLLARNWEREKKMRYEAARSGPFVHPAQVYGLMISHLQPHMFSISSEIWMRWTSFIFGSQFVFPRTYFSNVLLCSPLSLALNTESLWKCSQPFAVLSKD